MRYHCVVIHIDFLEIQGTITNSQFILNIFSIDMLNRLFNNLPIILYTEMYYSIARITHNAFIEVGKKARQHKNLLFVKSHDY